MSGEETNGQTHDDGERDTTQNAARHDADGTPTDHPAGEEQARQNAEEELPG